MLKHPTGVAPGAYTGAMTWQPELDELERRRLLAEKLGGEDKIERQHKGGRLTVRERIDALLDPSTFEEVGGLAGVCQFLSYLPNSVYDLPPRVEPSDDPNRALGEIANLIPRDKRKVYKMRPIIDQLVDRGSFFEMSKMYGRSTIAGFARLNGWPVALIASDPYFQAGAWTAAACQKIIRFVDTAQTFHLPVVYLEDCPGFLVGLEAEKAGTIRQGVRAMSAINQSTVPWCTIIVRNAYGVAGAAHRPTQRYSVRYAWVTARWGSLPLEGGIEAAYRADLDAAEDPIAELEEIKDRLKRLQSPFRTAEPFWVEDIIDPARTRKLLCDFADLAAPVRQVGPSSFGMRP